MTIAIGQIYRRNYRKNQNSGSYRFMYFQYGAPYRVLHVTDAYITLADDCAGVVEIERDVFVYSFELDAEVQTPNTDINISRATLLSILSRIEELECKVDTLEDKVSTLEYRTE